MKSDLMSSAFELLDLHRGDRVVIIGSGGKTTLLKRLAAQAAGLGLSTIITTTTHLAPPPGLLTRPARAADVPAETYPLPFYNFEDLAGFINYWNQLASPRGLLTARLCASTGHLRGLTSPEAGVVAALTNLDFMVVEADGSKRLPIKVHSPQEPVLFPGTTCGIAVIGMQALGRSLTKGSVHRPELMCKLLQADSEHLLTLGDMASVAISYLYKLPYDRKFLILSQAEAMEAQSLKYLADIIRRCLKERVGQIFCQSRENFWLCP